MVYVFQRFLSCPNNKHHIVMYIGLFYHWWQHETCEQTQGDLFQSLSTAVCGKRHLACHHINFSYFAWQKFALFFVFWVYALMARRTLCIVVVFGDFGDYIGRALINRFLPLTFSWTCFLNYVIVFQFIYFPC